MKKNMLISLVMLGGLGVVTTSIAEPVGYDKVDRSIPEKSMSSDQLGLRRTELRRDQAVPVGYDKVDRPISETSMLSEVPQRTELRRDLPYDSVSVSMQEHGRGLQMSPMDSYRWLQYKPVKPLSAAELESHLETVRSKVKTLESDLVVKEYMQMIEEVRKLESALGYSRPESRRGLWRYPLDTNHYTKHARYETPGGEDNRPGSIEHGPVFTPEEQAGLNRHDDGPVIRAIDESGEAERKTAKVLPSR